MHLAFASWLLNLLLLLCNIPFGDVEMDRTQPGPGGTHSLGGRMPDRRETLASGMETWAEATAGQSMHPCLCLREAWKVPSELGLKTQ